MFSPFIHPYVNNGNVFSLVVPSWKWSSLLLLVPLGLLFLSTSMGFYYIIESYYKKGSGYDEPHLNYGTTWELYHEDLIKQVEKVINESPGVNKSVRDILPT